MIELERKVEALVRCVGRERFDEMLRQLPEADKPMRLGSWDIEDLLTELGIPSSHDCTDIPDYRLLLRNQG